ncbi:ATP-binding cassette domain-containing protein [Thalassotalea sp. HSM 43]|uniref:oligopeptide/dipeptide ABC transporter ATP-binding protein n=1 Tax=Thalassotalea sp. HSM 43 TaxID=2552945 RepID=UPI0010804A7C|nr:oligopeptide/dipeptide ABC transporter ATP-binding protein [Thalassotalea sp. HSM 43]QBY05302.1 ATP-binding cassette domain-containing protein [Thalassotalea sp. HSM 43]
MNLLDIKNLSIELTGHNENIVAVDRVSLVLKDGDFRGLVGESGSGKSILAQAIIGVLDDKWHVSADRFHWQGVDILRLPIEERQQIINRDVAMIFQEPISCLDPTNTIAEEIEEALDNSQFSGFFWQRAAQRKEEIARLLHKVGIKNHQNCAKSYPHQLNNALCQRVMIAIALAKKPKLLIADEPTASMEAVNQNQIFRLLASLNQLKNMSVLLISHELEKISYWTKYLTVMYSGQFVEAGTTTQILKSPFHPYTRALVASTPTARKHFEKKQLLETLPGSIPSLSHLPTGCRLGPRCPNAQKKCVKAPTLESYQGHQVSCHFPHRGNK